MKNDKQAHKKFP